MKFNRDRDDQSEGQSSKRSRLSRKMAAGQLDFKSLENETDDAVKTFMRAKLLENE
jgi:hypothetical protein